MALGLPILTLDHHGPTDFISNRAGIKVPVQAPEATAASLARAVEYLHRHSTELAQMGRAGFAYAGQHSWPALVAVLLRHVKKALQPVTASHLMDWLEVDHKAF